MRAIYAERRAKFREELAAICAGKQHGAPAGVELVSGLKAAQAEARRVAAIQRDTIAALALATPPALAARFDSLARCMEASVVGARILRAAGIEARVVPCVARAHDEQANFAIFMGYSRAELAAQAQRDPAELENLGHAEDELHLHVVIEAHPAAGRTLIDLTVCQMLGNAQTLVMPLEKGWPAVQCGKRHIEYRAALRPEYVEERIAYAHSLDFSGQQADVVDLMRLSKLHRCDKDGDGTPCSPWIARSCAARTR